MAGPTRKRFFRARTKGQLVLESASTNSAILEVLRRSLDFKVRRMQSSEELG